MDGTRSHGARCSAIFFDLAIPVGANHGLHELLTQIRKSGLPGRLQADMPRGLFHNPSISISSLFCLFFSVV